MRYTRGCSVHWGISLSKLGDIQHTVGCSAHPKYTGGEGGTISTLGDTMMSVGDIMSTPGDVQYTGVSIQIQLLSQ